MKNKGISLVSLIIMIIVIIILATIGGVYLSKNINDSVMKDAREELKNVQEIVGSAKAEGLADRFTPSSAYKVDDKSILVGQFGLESDVADRILEINNDASIDPLKKYYVMDQAKFDSEFGTEMTNVRGLKREYLVSYYDRVVILNVNGEVLSSGKIDSVQPTYGEIKVVFNPNGSVIWDREQGSTVTVQGDGITSSKYYITQSFEEPASTFFTNTFSSGSEIKIQNKTGNNWYIWVLVNYVEDGIGKTYLSRSNAFYVDNEAPHAEMSISGVTR